MVIEIDAQQSDHSGEPVVTFLGPLLAEKTPGGKSVLTTLGEKGLKLAGVAGRSVARAVLRNGAEEIIAAAGDFLAPRVAGQKALKESLEDIEVSLSTYASRLIDAQLAAEHARQTELPAQIRVIRDALTEGKAQKRVVVLIDELDRCRPDYAIALLEAMKLVFNQDGFVFVLMVNKEYLESIADHRFGTARTGESYLEKFVDLRLKLAAAPEAVAEATRELVARIDLAIPFGEAPEFSVTAAADLAAQIAPQSGLSFRQIKRVIARVELAARCYQQRPIDLPLLVYLAFAEVAKGTEEDRKDFRDLLPPARLTRDELARRLRFDPAQNFSTQGEILAWHQKRLAPLVNSFFELARYDLPDSDPGSAAEEQDNGIAREALRGVVPDHQAMLDAVHRIQAD